MGLNQYARDLQTRSTELCNRLDKEHGLWILPIIVMITLATVPFMFIEMVTFKQEMPVDCRHRINNKRENYRRDPYCVLCGEPLCTSRSERGGTCMLIRGHRGNHRNPYLKDFAEWTSQGSTLLNENMRS